MTKPKETDYEITEGNVFAALGLDNPEELLARAKLLNEVSTLIKKSGFTQSKIAKKLGITQSKVSLLVGGHLSAFSTETLMHYLSILGCGVEIRLHKPRSRIGIFRSTGYIAVC
ncbi:MAG: helix-turn-helix domain-containing protein [Rhabdochlamydiaceae bacterium]